MCLSHNAFILPLQINSVFFTNDTAVTEGQSLYVCVRVTYKPHQASLPFNASLMCVREYRVYTCVNGCLSVWLEAYDHLANTNTLFFFTTRH